MKLLELLLIVDVLLLQLVGEAWEVETCMRTWAVRWQGLVLVETHHIALELSLFIASVAEPLTELFQKLSCFILGREHAVIVQIGRYEAVTMALHIDVELLNS